MTKGYLLSEETVRDLSRELFTLKEEVKLLRGQGNPVNKPDNRPRPMAVGKVSTLVSAATVSSGVMTPGSGKVKLQRRILAGNTLGDLEEVTCYQTGLSTIAVDEFAECWQDRNGFWWVKPKSTFTRRIVHWRLAQVRAFNSSITATNNFDSSGCQIFFQNPRLGGTSLVTNNWETTAPTYAQRLNAGFEVVRQGFYRIDYTLKFRVRTTRTTHDVSRTTGGASTGTPHTHSYNDWQDWPAFYVEADWQWRETPLASWTSIPSGGIMRVEATGGIYEDAQNFVTLTTHYMINLPSGAQCRVLGGMGGASTEYFDNIGGWCTFEHIDDTYIDNTATELGLGVISGGSP